MAGGRVTGWKLTVRRVCGCPNWWLDAVDGSWAVDGYVEDVAVTAWLLVHSAGWIKLVEMAECRSGIGTPLAVKGSKTHLVNRTAT